MLFFWPDIHSKQALNLGQSDSLSVADNPTLLLYLFTLSLSCLTISCAKHIHNVKNVRDLCNSCNSCFTILFHYATQYSLKRANSNSSYFDSSFVICWDYFGCHQFTQKPVFHVYLVLQKVMLAFKDTFKRLFVRHILNREKKQTKSQKEKMSVHGFCFTFL